jgi:ATP synthase F0 sector subunit B
VEDEDSNIALVNGGEGDLVPCNDPKEVLAYGQQRLAKLSTPVKEPKLDPVTGKEKGGTWTSSMFVLHLPKSLCREVKDFYPVLDDDGHETGRRRSRWVARDRDEALQYFEDAMGYMAQEVIPGGWDAILGADIQFSESTPHIQVLADTFAPDPKHPGQLRTEFSRAYGSHRDVRDDKGRQISGQAKFRRYQDGLRQRMVELGWPVERDVDPLRHDKTATKDMYGALKDKERALAEKREQIKIDREELMRDGENLEREEYQVRLARKEVEEERSVAREEGRQEGRNQGFAEGFAKGQAEARRLMQTARERLTRAETIYAEAMTARSIPDEQAYYLASLGANTLASAITKHVDPQTCKEVEKACVSVRRSFAKNAKLLIGQAREAERSYGNKLVSKRVQVSQAREALGDDGLEF